MRKKIFCILGMAILSFSLIQCVHADEYSELKQQVETMQKQMEEMKRKIEQPENPSPGAVSVPVSVTDAPKCITSKGPVGKFELGGEVSIQFVDTQADDATSEPEPHFALDKVSLQPAIQMTEDIRFEADIEIEEGEANLDESYFIFSHLPLNSTLKVGKDDRFFGVGRYTEKYPLTGNAFWRDEEIGVVWKPVFNPFYMVLSWSHGLDLSTRQAGEDESYELIHDNTKTSNYEGVKQISGGLGFKRALGESSEIDVLGWGLYNKLSQADRDFLAANLDNYISEDDDQHRVGLNFKYTMADLDLTAQYIDARDGELNRSAWFVQPSYKVKLPFAWKYYTNHRLLLRYGQLDVDNTKSFDHSVTWDREELTVAVISDITENFKFKNEYTINDEKTGNGDVDNNELLLRLEYEF